MKHVLWIALAAVIAVALLAGRGDIRRFRAMRDM